MTAFLGGWLVRSSLLILAGALALRLLRVKNPSLLLTAWTAALAGSLALPLLSAALPRVPMAVWRMPAGRSAAAPAAARGAGASRPAPAAAPGPVSRPPASEPFDWARFGVKVYAVAAAALLFRLLAGLALSLRMLRRSRPTGIAWGGTEARESDEVATPVTVGILRPAMLLPADWRGWTSAQLDAVLAHEQSHIRRRDPAVQFVSAIHRALLWASPASWFLHNRLVRAAEEVSDDDAIAATRDRVRYAEILLGFIERSGGVTGWAGVPMARYDRPERRIRRILDGTGVPRGVTRGSMAAVLALGMPIAYVAAAAHPQAAAPKQLPEFEVASIRPIGPDIPHEMGVRVYPGGRVTIAAFPLKSLVATAFGMAYWQISGGDQWTEKEDYDIEAKPPEALRSRIHDLRYTLFDIEDEGLREMLQALLIERFQLKFHRETKMGDVYLLERNGKPLALRPMTIPGTGSGAASPDAGTFGSIGYVGGKWGVFATSMPQLAQFASRFVLHVPVLDRTEVAGWFDYTQRWPDPEPKYSGDQSVSFRGFLQETGLRLERAKGPVDALVIDHAARPSPN